MPQGRAHTPFHAGFSLGELLVVITIISVLATIAMLNFRRQTERGYDARRKSDLMNFKIAFEDYYNDHNCYPSEEEWNGYACGGSDFAPYIDPFPCDPVTGEHYYYVTIADGSGGSCGGYRLYASLSDTSDPDIRALGCGSAGCGYGIPEKYNFGISVGGTVAEEGFVANPTSAATPAPTSYIGSVEACNPNGVCNVKDSVQQAIDVYGCPADFIYPRGYCVDSECTPEKRCLR